MFGIFIDILLLHLFTFTFYKCIENEDALIKSFTKTPEETSYSLDSSVTLNCKLKIIDGPKIVVFRKDRSMKSEGCNVFDSKKYEIECLTESETDVTYKVFKFTIKHIGWEDRGKWECFYIQNIKVVNIEIKVNPIFEPLRVVSLPRINENTADMDMRQTQSHRLMGRGSRTNPYNLRDGTTVNITCHSSCSYPEIIHKWIYKNSTHTQMELKAHIQDNRDKCNSDKGMIASRSEVTINCTSMHVVGANLLMCSASGESDSRNASVYILCPGGERPWEFTTGEIVGVSVSVGIFIVLIAVIHVLIKRSRYTTVSGEESTKTYSSGVKV